jgi:branched-chain amino acid transport system ATP-binding protein
MSGSNGQSLLAVKELEVVYHRVATAIQGVSLRVPEGGLVAMVGSNGAGKTTTLRAISGFLHAEDVRVTEGTIEYRGQRIDGLHPHERVRRGIVLVPERAKVFETLTVADNLAVNVTHREARGERLHQVFAYFPRLRERQRQVAGYLSGGEKQMLAIAMALLCDPRLLLVDELSMGLAPMLVADLMASLRRMNRELGLSILLVEQNAMAALRIAHYAYVMENGRIVFDGTPDRLLRHQDVREFYLGMDAGSARSYERVKQYRRKRRWWG